MSKSTLDMVGDYLAHRLEGSELETFEIQLLDDPQLQSEVEIHMAIKLALSEQANQDEVKTTVPSPATFDRVVYIESMRGADSKVSLKSNESVCLAVDVGPFYFTSVEVNITRDEQAITQEIMIVDPEGLVNVPWKKDEPGNYALQVTSSEIDRHIVIEVV